MCGARICVVLILLSAALHSAAQAQRLSLTNDVRPPSPFRLPDPVIQSGHSAEVLSLAFSADGKMLATASVDGTVKLWFTETGQLLRTFVVGSYWVYSVAISKDGTRLATGSGDHRVNLWDLSTGKKLWSSQAHEHAVEVVRFSPDGKYLAAGGTDDAAKPAALVFIWESDSGKIVLRIRGTGTVSDLGFLPGGVLAGAVGLNVRFWDLSSGRLLDEFSATNNHVVAVLVSPDGTAMATAGVENVPVPGTGAYSTARLTKIWRLSGGRPDHSPLFTLPGSTAAWIASNGGSILAIRGALAHSGGSNLSGWRGVVGYDETDLVLLDVPSGRSLARRSCALKANLLVASPDGRQVAAADGREIRIADLNNCSVRTVSPPPLTVKSVAASADGRLVAAGFGGGGLVVWDTVRGEPTRDSERYLAGEEIRTLVAERPSDVRSLTFAADDGTVLILNQGTAVLQWALDVPGPPRVLARGSGNFSTLKDTGRLESRRDPTSLGRPEPPRALRVCVDGDCPEEQPYRDVFTSAVSPKRRYAAFGGYYSYQNRQSDFVSLVDTATQKEIALIRHPDTADKDVTALAFSPDEESLLIGYSQGRIILWDVPQHEQKYELQAHANAVNALQFSPNGDLFASASSDGNVKLWKRDGPALVHTFSGHSAAVLCIAFSPDGSGIASGGADNSVLVWDSRSGEMLSAIQTHSAPVTSIAYSSKRNLLITGSDDGTIALFGGSNYRQLVSAVSFGPGKWLAFTPDGLFDGTASGMDAMAWRVPDGGSLWPLEAFFNDFFSAGILARTVDGNAPKAQLDIGLAVQVPGLRTMIAQKQAHLENRNGRVLACFSQVPGVAVGIEAGGSDIPAEQHGFQVVPGDPTCKYRKELEGVTDGSELQRTLTQSSPEPFRTVWDGRLSKTRNSIFHVLSVGIGQYGQGSGFDALPYAAASAGALERYYSAGSRDPGKLFAGLHVWPGLYDSAATLDRVRERLRVIAQTIKPDDVLLLYFAGHGVISVGQEMFYFVPADGKESDLRHTALNTAMLAEALRGIPARRIVVVLDACQSGGAIEALSKVGQVKAWTEQTRASPEKRETDKEDGIGVHLIAAAMPLAYAVQVRENESALAATLLESLQIQGAGPTAKGVVEAIQERLPQKSEAVTGFRQVPLAISIGLDFPLPGGTSRMP